MRSASATPSVAVRRLRGVDRQLAIRVQADEVAPAAVGRLRQPQPPGQSLRQRAQRARAASRPARGRCLDRRRAPAAPAGAPPAARRAADGRAAAAPARAPPRHQMSPVTWNGETCLKVMSRTSSASSAPTCASFQSPWGLSSLQQIEHRAPLGLRPQLVVFEHRPLQRAQMSQIRLREQALVQLHERRRRRRRRSRSSARWARSPAATARPAGNRAA